MLNLKNQQEAFGFIELSVILLVLSLSFIFALTVTERIEDAQKNEVTEERILELRKALAVYFKRNAELPCPADISLNIYDANFGVASNTTQPNCSTSSGMLNFATDNYIGAVPVATLNLPQDYAFDAWGNKLTYAISKASRNIFTSTSDFPDNSDMDCWLDAADASTLTLRVDSGSYYVEEMSDKSANGLCDFVQTSNNEQPQYHAATLATNNLGGIYFPGEGGVAGYKLENTNSSILAEFEDDYTIFFVLTKDYTGGRGAILSLIDNTAPLTHNYFISNARYLRLNYVPGGITDIRVASEFLERDIEVVAWSKVSIGSDYDIDNVRIHNGNIDNISDAGDHISGIDVVMIGDDESNEIFEFKGHLYEFIMYGKKLDSSEVDQIVDYLYAKWDSKRSNYNQMIINEYDDTVQEAVADLVIVSHGANGYGAYNKAGVQNSTENIGATEDNNIFESGRQATFYTDMVSDTELGQGWQSDFDDIVRYYNLHELIGNAGGF